MDNNNQILLPRSNKNTLNLIPYLVALSRFSLVFWEEMSTHHLHHHLNKRKASEPKKKKKNKRKAKQNGREMRDDDNEEEEDYRGGVERGRL